MEHGISQAFGSADRLRNMKKLLSIKNAKLKILILVIIGYSPIHTGTTFGGQTT